MPETPRTCTLGGAVFGIKLIGATGEIKPGERVQFIERVSVDAKRERMLDLVAGLEELLSTCVEMAEGDDCVVDEARSLLREHDRLKAGEDA